MAPKTLPILFTGKLSGELAEISHSREDGQQRMMAAAPKAQFTTKGGQGAFHPSQ